MRDFDVVHLIPSLNGGFVLEGENGELLTEEDADTVDAAVALANRLFPDAAVDVEVAR